MSQVPNTPSTSSLSNFQSIFNAAVERYDTRTKNKLLTHPLAAQLQSCDSPTAVLSLLQGLVQQFDQGRSNDESFRSWLNPTVNVLFAFSATLGEGVGLVKLYRESLYILVSDHRSLGFFARESNICWYWHSFPGKYPLRSHTIPDHCDFDACQAAKDVDASQDMLIDLFVRIESFFRRLESYTEVQPTTAMTDIIVKIMVEILSILAIATKDIKQRRASELIPSVAI